VANIGTQPLTLGSQIGGQQNTQLLEALSQLLGGANQYQASQNQFNLGLADIPASIIRSILSGEQQKSIAQLQADAQKSTATTQAVGSGVGAAISTIPSFLKVLFPNLGKTNTP
jgi:hypothetical protein